MAEASQRFKSPPYPFLDLEAAVERATQLGDVAKGFAVPVTTAAKAWSYSPTSSSTIKVLGALNQFGLIDDEGTGDTKGYRLSDLGDIIVRDRRPNSSERAKALRQAALSPKVFFELWEKFKTAAVDVDTIIHELTLGRKRAAKAEYSTPAAEEIAARYRASLQFAKVEVEGGANGEYEAESPNPAETGSDPQPKIGDQIHWTSGGVDQFATPATITGLSDDGKWAWTDQGSTAVPIGEVKIVGSADDGKTPPPMPPHLANAMRARNPSASTSQFEEKKALDEGEAILIWPKDLSADSVDDMDYWLKGVLRQIRRRAGVAPKEG